jgi:hypothetical protein
LLQRHPQVSFHSVIQNRGLAAAASVACRSIDIFLCDSERHSYLIDRVSPPMFTHHKSKCSFVRSRSTVRPSYDTSSTHAKELAETPQRLQSTTTKNTLTTPGLSSENYFHNNNNQTSTTALQRLHHSQP